LDRIVKKRDGFYYPLLFIRPRSFGKSLEYAKPFLELGCNRALFEGPEITLKSANADGFDAAKGVLRQFQNFMKCMY